MNSSNKKYVFTGEVKVVFGITLKRIKRLSDGLIGGWIEKEKNLSQVSGDARIEKKSDCLNLINLCFSITVTPQNAVVGCQLKTHKEWLKVSLKEAILMGLPKTEYTLFKELLKLLFKKVGH